MADILLFGNSHFTEMIYHYFTHKSPHTVVAFTLNDAYIQASEFMGLPVVPFENIQTSHPPDRYGLFIGLGYPRRNGIREAKFREGRDMGYELVSFIHPSVEHFPDFTLGANTMILEHCVIEPRGRVGDNCILINTCLVAHHSSIEDHCYLSPHVIVCGNTTIGRNTTLGANALVYDDIVIGDHCVVHGSAVVRASLPPGTVFPESAPPASSSPGRNRHPSAPDEKG